MSAASRKVRGNVGRHRSQSGEWDAQSSQEGTDEDSGPESSAGDGEEEEEEEDTSDTEGHLGGHAPASELDEDNDVDTEDELPSELVACNK
eukprot:84985-Pelagomonas_calceolata.AAC.3